jgi:hypothetical protein
MSTRAVPPTGQLNDADQSRAWALFTVSTLLIVEFPGALPGAAVALAVWTVTRPDLMTRWLLAGLCAATAGILQPPLEAGWPWRLLAQAIGGSPDPGLTVNGILASIPHGALFGPLVLVAFQLGAVYRRRTIHGQEWARFTEVERRKKALERGWPGPGGRSDSPSAVSGHPPGKIRLGISPSDGRPFDLDINEIAQHVFIPGASGSGKTTTLVRLADGALANGYGVVIIDCKGVGLGEEARTLATRNNVPFTIVDPRDPDSIGYDPCSGDAPTIANKLIGAFSFSGEAEIYKQVAMEVIPVVSRAMTAANIPITLDEIYAALGKGGLGRLGRQSGAEKYRQRLEDLEDAGGVGTAGYVGFQKRLGALMEGSFGELFRKLPALDWDQEMSAPRITYLSLSTTGTSEDAELFGRVITQDLKQVCDQRMRAIERGQTPTPVLIIYDEFAALREARQIVDLLLQARQARAPLVVATQYLPEEVPIRKPVLSAGVLVVHRLEAQDANAVAAEFGTHTTTALTAQVDYVEGTSEKGSVRWVEEFNIHPNELKALPVGVAAVYARRTNRQQLVQILRTV